MPEREKTVSFVGSVIVFFILLFVYSKWGPAIPFSTVTQSKGEPFVVTGEGKVTVSPDIAKINLGIQETGSSLKTVQDNVNKKEKVLTDSLKKLGIDDKDIKTTSYYVYPQYDYSAPAQRITGYQVSTSYEVTIKDFEKVNDAIVAATNAGTNNIGGINFEVNDTTKKEKLQEARDAAVKDAKEKAGGLAKSAGITLGKIINISENQNQNDLRQFAVPMAGGSGTAKEIAPPNIQPGTTDIDIVISLSYEVR
jgi:uncharacterized protein YggE